MLSKVKKGDMVALVGFTGIRLTDIEIIGATKTLLKALKKDGSEMVFDRKTGVQKNVVEGKERYANKIMSLEEAPVNKPRKPRVKKEKKAKVEEIEEIEDDGVEVVEVSVEDVEDAWDEDEDSDEDWEDEE